MCNVQKRTGTKLLAFLVTLLFAVIWIAGSGIHVSAGQTRPHKKRSVILRHRAWDSDCKKRVYWPQALPAVP